MTQVNAYGPAWVNWNEPFALGPTINGFEPNVVQFANGFGANNVYRLDVIVPAMFPVQFPVAFNVYVAFKFMKSPVVVGIRVCD